MTPEQALQHYREHGTFYMDDKGYGELAELIEGQAAEIAKKDRMIESLKNLRDIQGQKGNYDQGEYMRGMFNGLEVAVSVFTQTEPQFKEWLEKEAEVQG